MRPDMAKVIVERPRYGSRSRSRKKGYRKYQQQMAFEDLPRCEPMLGRWRGLGKCLNEHLGPLRRFLVSNVGRPWNKVHQELCTQISCNNAVQAHILTHLYQYVHRYVEFHSTRLVVISCDRRWLPLWPGELYVCPQTGLLKRYWPRRRQSTPSRVIVSPTHQYHFREQAWWELKLRPKPSGSREVWDVWLEKSSRHLSDADCLAAYKIKSIAISKRPLSRAESRLVYDRIRHQRRFQERQWSGIHLVPNEP